MRATCFVAFGADPCEGPAPRAPRGIFSKMKEDR